MTGSSELHYKLDEAFTTNPYDGLLTKWDENDEARAEYVSSEVVGEREGRHGRSVVYVHLCFGLSCTTRQTLISSFL